MRKEPIDYPEGPDGRQVCNLKTAEGKRIYFGRVNEMIERQNDICCLFGYSPVCHPRGLLTGYRATFEHENGRGMNGWKRDDRIAIDGVPINGAAHLQCNYWKGSRFIDYNAKHRAVSETEEA